MSSPSSPTEYQPFHFGSSPRDTMSEKDFVLYLISLYRDLPELWDVECDGYRNKIVKNKAYKTMAKALQQYRPDYDEYTLKKKINMLRTNFNKEYNRITERRMTGEYAEDQLQPALWYYNDIYFIKERSKATNVKVKTEAVQVQPSTSQSTPAKKLKRSATNERTHEKTESLPDMATVYVQYSKKVDEEMDILCKNWAIKLTRLPPDQRLFAEKIINDTLFEAEMGTLTRNGVRFLTTPTPAKHTVSSGACASPNPNSSP